MDCGGRSGFATPARRVAEKLAPSLRWAQGKTAMRPCRLDLATVRQGSIASGGWIAEEGRVLRRVRNRSVLENASKLLLPHLLAPNEVKAQVFPQPAERAPPEGYIFHKNYFSMLPIASTQFLPFHVTVLLLSISKQLSRNSGNSGNSVRL